MESLIDDPLISFLFLSGGLVAMALEVFVPSGGILGVSAIACLAFGAYGLHHQGHTLLASASALVYLVSFFLLFRLFLRRLRFPTVQGPEASSTPADRRAEGLRGKEGVALTALRPAGMARFGDEKVDVVTAGEFVEKDESVRVIDVAGNRVVVKRIDSAGNSISNPVSNPVSNPGTNTGTNTLGQRKGA